MPNRDPLSVAFDTVTRPVLIQAIRHLRSKRRGPLVWIASTRAELRSVDKGGRTRQERAFMRSAYYHVWRVPLNQKPPQLPKYALTMEWGDQLEPSSRGRFARSCRVTLHKRGVRGPGGGKPLPPGSGWVGFQSTPDNRIDS